MSKINLVMCLLSLQSLKHILNGAFEVQFFSGLHSYTLSKTLIACTCRTMQLRFLKMKSELNNVFNPPHTNAIQLRFVTAQLKIHKKSQSKFSSNRQNSHLGRKKKWTIWSLLHLKESSFLYHVSKFWALKPCQKRNMSSYFLTFFTVRREPLRGKDEPIIDIHKVVFWYLCNYASKWNANHPDERLECPKSLCQISNCNLTSPS